jgi:hypothetical protein
MKRIEATMMTKAAFKYGINPHESITAGRLPPMDVLVGSLSFNAYLDIYAGFQVSSPGSRRAVYLKHLTPLFAQPLGEGDVTLPERVMRVNGGREFGCFVYRGLLTCAILDTLLSMPSHTIAAEAIDPDVPNYAASGPIQKRNRGLTLVRASIPWSRETMVNLSNTVHDVTFEDSKPDDEENGLVHRTLKYCRTIATNVYSAGDLIYTICGEFDTISGLRRALDVVGKNGFGSVDIVTDACFGVASPVSILRDRNVRSMSVFGEKSNYGRLGLDLAEAGVSLRISPHRAFAYMP